MPFMKDISVRASKEVQAQQLTVSITSFATGSAGYFTSSASGSYEFIAGGATAITPVTMTISASVQNGTAPYLVSWTSSYGESSAYPFGINRNSSSLTYDQYSLQDTKWEVRVSDSSTPIQVASASVYAITVGAEESGNPVVWAATNGTNLPKDLHSLELGGFAYGNFVNPVKKIDDSIKYAVPNETRIKVKSGIFPENPVINKKIHSLNGAADGGTSSISSSNYFIYSTKEFPTGIRHTNVITGFNSSSFSTIAVSTTGSIQTAIYDVAISGTIQILPGVHEITGSISASVGTRTTYYIQGKVVPTGSSDTYIYDPESKIRLSSTISTESIFRINDYGLGGNSFTSSHPIYISNLELQITNTGSFFYIPNPIDRHVICSQMVMFSIVTGSTVERMMTLTERNANSNNSSVFPLDKNYNINNLIIDNRDAGFGNSYVHFGKYTPIVLQWGNGNSQRIDYLRALDNLFHNVESNFYLDPMGMNGLGISGSRVNSTNNVDGTAANTVSTNVVASTRRGILGRGDNRYNGHGYLLHTSASTTGTSVWYVEQSQRLLSNSSSFSTFCVFTPSATASVTYPRRTFYKWGDHENGFNITFTSSRLEINLYASSSNGATRSLASMHVNNVEIEKMYLAELFFDGSSTNKRIGMALYDSASMITSSYFTSTQFPLTEVLGQRVDNTLISFTSIGAKTGAIRLSDNYTFATTGRADPYWGSFSTVALYSTIDQSPTVRNAAHSDEFCRSVYNVLRRKYFPTSSIVQRGISSDLA